MVTETNNRHQEILQMALDIIAEKGAKALSMRTLAKAVGLSAPSLYEYFRNKEDLMRQCSGVAQERIYKMLSDALNAAPAPHKLLMLGLAYQEVATTHEHLFLLATKYPPQSINLVTGEAKCQLINLFRLALYPEADVSVADDTEIRNALSLWSMLHGYLNLTDGALKDNMSRTPEQLSAMLTVWQDHSPT